MDGSFGAGLCGATEQLGYCLTFSPAPFIQGANVAEGSIEIYESEDRRFPPSAAFVAQANANDRSMWDEAEADYEAFWARQARELLTWHKDFGTVLEWELPFSKWFVGGELNISYNCLDRHVRPAKATRSRSTGRVNPATRSR